MHHNAIRDTLFEAAQSAALAQTREALGVVAGSHSRPADILFPTWRSGCPAALDIHVISIGVGTCWKQGAQEVAAINYKLIFVNNYYY